MKFKYYLRGAGVGVIVETVVLSAAFLFQDEMSDAQIIQRALELGMVMEEDTPKTLADMTKTDDGNKENPDAGADDEGQSGDDSQDKQPSDKDGPDTDDKNTGAGQPEQDQKPDSQKNTNEKDNPPKQDGNGGDTDNQTDSPDDTKPENPDNGNPDISNGNKVTVTIVGGDVSRTVSAKVFEAGLVESADEFNAFLGSNNYDNQLQPGTYEITKGASFDEIARILTSR